MGILFKHKFKPDDIILDLASKFLDPEVSEIVDDFIVKYGTGEVTSRYEEKEVIVKSYKANTITLCKNVTEFTLMVTALNSMAVYDAIMDRLNNKSD